jgi:hypothetical protein
MNSRPLLASPSIPRPSFRRPTLSAAAALLLAGLAGCGGGTEDGEDLYPIGSYCGRDAECESGICGDSQCTIACGADTECAALAGGLTVCGGSGRCEEPCSEERAVDDRDFDGEIDNICLADHWTACTTLDASYCDVCDGLCPGQRCLPGTGCAPLSDLGEDCLVDSDCRTDNCSAVAHVCRAPLGAACDATNCDVCISEGTWSWCSRECGDDIRVNCGSDDERDYGLCLGSREAHYYWCRPACGAACTHGSCQTSSDGSISYCDDFGGASWSVSGPPRALLEPCRFSSECASGQCLTAAWCDDGVSSCTAERGFCTAGCTADAECGAGGHCVDVPCVGGATTGCGNVCLPACDPDDFSSCNRLAGAACRELSGVAGGGVLVCDPRNVENERCRDASDCLSGTCAGARCAPAGGLANGAGCTAPTDCASGNCQTGVCRGTSLRGDPCATEWDCSVGTCVSGICD